MTSILQSKTHYWEFFTIQKAPSLVTTCIAEWKLDLFVILGPAVTVQHPFVYFNCIKLGEYLNQPLDIINNSDVPAYYQFDIDCTQSVFSIDRPYGVLNGMSTITLKVTFQPTHPIICYRRVVCLVHHQVSELRYVLPLSPNSAAQSTTWWSSTISLSR